MLVTWPGTEPMNLTVEARSQPLGPQGSPRRWCCNLNKCLAQILFCCVSYCKKALLLGKPKDLWLYLKMLNCYFSQKIYLFQTHYILEEIECRWWYHCLNDSVILCVLYVCVCLRDKQIQLKFFLRQLLFARGKMWAYIT